MFDYKNIVRQIDKVLDLTSKILTETQIESIRSLNHAGEWHLSFETLCDLLYEYESPISQQIYNSLKEIGQTLSINQDFWEVLASQIDSDL